MDRNFLHFVFLLVLCPVVYVSGQNVPLYDSDKLLDNSMKWLTWQESVSMQVQVDIQGKENNVQNFHVSKTYTFRRDNERTEWIGKIISYEKDGSVGENSYERKQIMTGEHYLETSNLFEKKPELGFIRLKYKEIQENMLDDADTGGPLFGRVSNTGHKTIIDILKEVKDVSLSNDQKDINGILCHEIKGKSQYGELTVWIASNRGNSVIKWMIHKNPENYTGPLKIKNWLAIYEVKELVHIEDSFVPGVANYTLRIEKDDGIEYTSTYNYKVDNVILKPDFEAIGAFKINLPDGTPIRIVEHPAIKYVWKNGKPVTDVDQSFLDVLDSEVEQLKSEAKVEPEKVGDKKNNIPSDESPAVVNLQTDSTQLETVELQRKTLSKSTFFLVAIGLLIIGWLIFRQQRKDS